jgi:hypothetical protein
MTHRIYEMPFAAVWVLYIKKLERKERTEQELIEVTTWLTGFTPIQLNKHIDDQTTFREFLAKAKINQKATEIKGVICGVRIEEIEDPLMKQIRYLDKLVDELYKGRPMAKVLRTTS